jgi:2-C-methyl-D-erythritol 2,4-cyclodiphosphate synthase
MIRIGHGYDVHAFTEGEHLRLGGVDIPFSQAFKAHSDGDVLIHALCDALLGSLALGDIGLFYPDTDARHQGRNSLEFLHDVMSKVRSLGYELNNADITVIAQAPKLRPFVDVMRETLATCMQVAVTQVSVKATTTEGLGPMGRGEGVAVHAVVIVAEASL